MARLGAVIDTAANDLVAMAVKKINTLKMRRTFLYVPNGADTDFIKFDLLFKTGINIIKKKVRCSKPLRPFNFNRGHNFVHHIITIGNGFFHWSARFDKMLKGKVAENILDEPVAGLDAAVHNDKIHVLIEAFSYIGNTRICR